MSAVATRDTIRRPAPRAVALWLLACCAMIFAMAVIGAITRLTESGLSIMEWAPVSGALPPLGEAEWRRLFALYQETGEYRSLPGGMSLAEFRSIFWWEWLHRLWGRLIGLVYLLPFLWFLWRRRVPQGYARPLWIGFALGALQGLVGWFMVASGFSERTDVSQYRLVLHLGLALAIYAYLLWLAFSLLRGPGRERPARERPAPRRGLVLAGVLLVLTLAAGGFVAGTDAGMTYNDFPTMDGRLVPAGYGALSPWWLNWFETIAAVQFNHRLLATLLLLGVLALAWSAWRRSPDAPLTRDLALLAAATLLQYALGVATLLAVVPVWLGALHQAGALLVLTLAVAALHRRFARPVAASGVAAPGPA